MTDIVSIPDHGARIIGGEGQANPELQRFFDDIVLLLNADRAQLKEYTVSDLPDASSGFGMVMVTDEVGGAVPAFSDLSNWRRVTDRAIVS